MIRKVALEQGTPEWLAYRLNGVGGSDIASIIGADGAFKKRQDVLMEKLGETRELSEFQKKLFQDGHEWEALVRDQMNQQGFNFKPEVVECPFNTRFFASLDGIDVEKECLLEVKSVTSMEKFKAYVENPPAHYLAQCQWQMLCTGYHTTLLAFVCQGEVAVKEIQSNPDSHVKLILQADQFLEELDRVKTGSVPAPIQNITSPAIERLAALKSASVQVASRLEELDEEIKSLATKILAEHGAVQIQGEGITIQLCEREGSVDYKKIPELQNLDLNPYRRKGTKYVKVSLNKQ